MAKKRSEQHADTQTPVEEEETLTEQPEASAGDAGAADEAGPETQPDAETPEAGDSAAGGEAEAPDTEAEPAAADDEKAQLQEEVAAARRQAEDYWNRLMRAEAEKENIRKRAEKDVEAARKQSLEKLAGELLSVRDSLEMGIDAAQQADADLEKVREGSELTLRMLRQAMEKFNIEEINPEGEKFNPDLHQAMSAQELEGYEPNTVVSVMQKGYRIGDRLLRPALVMVSK